MTPLWLLGVYAYLLTWLFLPAFLQLLADGGMTANTYREVKVPVGVGLALVFITDIVLITTIPFFMQWELEVLIFMFLLNTVALLGLLDDTAGSKKIKGLCGHLRFFWYNGRLSTGLLKAAGGGLIAFFVSYLISESIASFFLNGLLIALSINTLNLLDLRPGRAVKFYVFLMALIWICVQQAKRFYLDFILVGAVLAYYPVDIQGRAMLGDAGANVLGAAAGIALARYLPFGLKSIVLLFCFFLHMFSEFYSLTEIIETVPLLAYIDRLGIPTKRKS
ncbi:MAG: hypothetical protein ACOX3A_01280 [bacterium]|jgi:UDP-GlcNAc:undecaprenyl-phosphate GlcNAc-1-phosphate transferase